MNVADKHFLKDITRDLAKCKKQIDKIRIFWRHLPNNELSEEEQVVLNKRIERIKHASCGVHTAIRNINSAIYADKE